MAIGVGSFSILGGGVGGGKASEANFNTGGGGCIVKCTCTYV